MIIARNGVLPMTVVLLAVIAGPARAGGTLVIVGGALAPDNRAVHEAFVNALPEEGKVVIVPAASGSPARSARDIAAELQRYGVAPERLEPFPLAVRDDDTTPDVDERIWRDNAWNDALVAGLGEPAGFWFTGGDQIRIMDSLLRHRTGESPLLALIRERLAGGAVVGGSSAGAAIMSRHMIAGGDSFTALLEPVVRDYTSADHVPEGRLLLSGGAGFLPHGLVDQHFVSRARLGRLVRALAETGESFGYGIAEDTALVVDLDTGEAKVVGSGVVILLDASGATFDFDSGVLARKLALGFAAAGVRFPLGRCAPTGDVGSSTRGRESFDEPVKNQGGMAFPYQPLEELLGPGLLDNSAATGVERYSMAGDGRTLIYAFAKTDRSVGYRHEENGHSRYSVCDVRFDVSRAESQPLRGRHSPEHTGNTHSK